MNDIWIIGGPLCGQKIQLPADWLGFAHHLSIDDPLWRSYRRRHELVEPPRHWYAIEYPNVAIYQGVS